MKTLTRIEDRFVSTMLVLQNPCLLIIPRSAKLRIFPVTLHIETKQSELKKREEHLPTMNIYSRLRPSVSHIGNPTPIIFLVSVSLSAGCALLSL